MKINLEWIPVDHRPPDRFVKVLASFVEYGERKIVIAESWVMDSGERVWHQDSEWVTADGGWDGATKGHENLPITHWATMPPPPVV